MLKMKNKKLRTIWVVVAFLVCATTMAFAVNFLDTTVRCMYYTHIMAVSNVDEVPNPAGYDYWSDEGKFEYQTNLEAEMQEYYNKALAKKTELLQNNNIARWCDASISSDSGKIGTNVCIVFIIIVTLIMVSMFVCALHLGFELERRYHEYKRKSSMGKITKRLFKRL